MLKRIKDYYHWTKLSHWNDALINGSVTWGQMSDRKDIEDNVLCNAVELLIYNCYPISLICYHANMNGKVLLYNPLWNGIIQFVNGRRSIFVDGKDVFFQDLSENERCAILNANVHSVWITGGSDDDLSKISVIYSEQLFGR